MGAARALPRKPPRSPAGNSLRAARRSRRRLWRCSTEGSVLPVCTGRSHSGSSLLDALLTDTSRGLRLRLLLGLFQTRLNLRQTSVQGTSQAVVGREHEFVADAFHVVE